MKNLLLTFPNEENLAKSISLKTKIPVGRWLFQSFPDGESYVRVLEEIKNQEVVLLCSLNHPDTKLIPLLFLARTLKDLGASRVGLVAPYLAYMRQDKAFQSGEAVTSRYFAEIISSGFDWMLTIDPHLHRRRSLSEIYRVPALAVSAADKIAEWIGHHVTKPVLLGPDAESKQWVSEIAKKIKAPFLVFQKERKDAQNVSITAKGLESCQENTPVLMDDIISTAHTMIETVSLLKKAGCKPPVCIGVHAIFAENSYQALLASGPAQIVTCNTILHETNAIDVSDLLAENIKRLS